RRVLLRDAGLFGAPLEHRLHAPEVPADASADEEHDHGGDDAGMEALALLRLDLRHVALVLEEARLLVRASAGLGLEAEPELALFLLADLALLFGADALLFGEPRRLLRL